MCVASSGCDEWQARKVRWQRPLIRPTSGLYSLGRSKLRPTTRDNMSRLADVVDRRHSPAKLDFRAWTCVLIVWRRGKCCNLTPSVCANQRRARCECAGCHAAAMLVPRFTICRRQVGGAGCVRSERARALRPATQTSDCARAGSGCTSVPWCGCAGGTLARLEVTPACEGAWSPDAPAFPALLAVLCRRPAAETVRADGFGWPMGLPGCINMDTSLSGGAFVPARA
jgi:hypothetical protein